MTALSPVPLTDLLADHGDEWHEQRRKGIGASDAPRIMSGEWHELWLVKTGRQEPVDLSRVLPVQMGKFTEPLNVAWYARESGAHVTTENIDHLSHPDYPWMRANLDAWTDGVPLECKHVSMMTRDDAVVEKYYPQLQHQMLVTGAPRVVLSVFFGNVRWQQFPVNADPEYQAELLAREREFWSHVEMDIEPADKDAVAVPVDPDDMREADMTGNNAWASFAADWLTNRDPAKTFEKATKELKALVEPDVKRAHGQGVEIKRAKNNALSVKELKA